MMSDENDLKFRDQCAIQIFQMLIARDQENAVRTRGSDIIESCKLYHKYKKQDPIYAKSHHGWAIEKLHSLAQLSYQMADEMRKARLVAFE